MKRLSISLIVLSLIWVFSTSNDSVSYACENRKSVIMNATWSEYYDPCGNKLFWKVESTKVSDGSPVIQVNIEGAGIQEELGCGEFNIGDPILLGGSAYFADNVNHRLMLDFQPDVGSAGFAWNEGTRLIVDYILDQPN